MTPDRKPILSYQDEERIRAALADISRTDGLQAPAHLETALLRELRRRNRRGTSLRLLAAGAIAATVLFALFASRPEPVQQAPAVAVVTPVPASAPAPVQVQLPAPPPVLAAVPKRAPVVRRARPAVPRPEPVETVEFIPVGAWQAIEPIERGTIVRVRLPKSSLPGLGIPVSADRWSESFPADVVLAEDGSMRAIRFVSNVQ